MPIYKVQAPNGKIYNIEGPANADQNVLFQAANQLYEQDENKRLRKEYGPGLFGTLTEGVGRGVEQLKTTFGDVLPAMAGQALGFEDYAKAQMQEAAEAQERIQAERPPLFPSYKDVESPYQALQFAFEVLGEQIPNIATSLIPGVGGGVIAGRSALTAVGTSLAKEAAQKGLTGRAAAEFIEGGMKAAAPGIAAKSATGATAGAFLGSYSLNAPEIFQNVFEETGQMDVGASLLFGAGAAALDSILPAALAKQISGPLKTSIVEKVLERSGMDRGVLRSATAGLAGGVATEGLTEGAQEAISIAAEKFVGDNPQIFESKEWERIMEASVRGAVAGGGFGAAGGSVQRMREASQRKAQLADALERRGQRQEAARLRKEVVEAEQEIAELEGREPQMQLPGMETGVYTGLAQPEAVATKAQKAAKDTLSGKQISLFGPEGQLTKEAEKAATADQKRALNIARQRAQQEAAEQKKNQERLKKLLSAKQLTLPGMSVEELAQAQRQQAELQAQIEETGQGDLFAGMPATPAPAVEPTVTPEPVKREAPSGVEGTIISSEKTGLKAFGKQLGIGPTASILRPDGPLAGKDLSDPAQATEVKTILEGYASGKPAVGAAAKIEEFLERPEFQAVETEVPSERVTTEPVVGAVEPSVPSDLGRVEGGERGLGAEGIAEPVGTGLDELGPAAGVSEVGAESVERPLGVKEAKDVAKAEAATPEAVQKQADFVVENDRRTSDLLNATLREQSRDAGLPEEAIPAEDFIGTDAHNFLRMPGLLNEYFRLKDVIAIPPTSPAERAQTSRNQQELGVVRDAIVNTSPDAAQFLSTMEQVPVQQRQQLLSELNKRGRDLFDAEAKSRVEQAKQIYGERGAAPAARQAAPQLTEVDYDQLADEFNERFFEKTGKKLFLPIHRGPDLDADGRALVEAGDVKGLMDYLRNKSTSKPLRMILAKIKSLNLKTKIVVGQVGENQSGSFDPRTNTITLDPQNGLNEHTVLHELMHAAISHVLRNPNLPVTKQLTALFEQLQNQLGAAYGAQDIQEFAAELVSNPEFQALLKTIKAPKSKSMFARFMQTLAEFFGFAKGTNAYDKGLKLISDALDISGDVDPSVGDLMFLGTPNGASTGFGVVGRIGQAMPSLAGNTIENTRNYLSNMPGNIRSIAMGLLRLDNINDIYKKELPSVQKLLDALEMRSGMQERRIKQINENYKRFQKVTQKHPQAMDRMNDMAYDARLAQVDVIDPKFKPSPAQQADYNRLKGIYDRLPPDVQKVYRDIRADYDASINEYEDILLNSVEDPSVRRKLKAQYEARKRQVAYIPFLRRGEFWVEYDENGERAVQAFESQRERQRFIDTQLKGKQFSVYQNLNQATFSQGTLPPTSFIVGVMNQLNKQGASQELKNNIYQSYLALFPAESLSKNFMKADNVRGMERDIVRGYGETMIKWARKLSASKFNPDIDKALGEIALQGEAASRTPDGAGAVAAAQNIGEQAQFIHNPTYGKLVSAATTFSYFNYIAGNISSAFINLSTIPMFSWSTLGAKHGFDKAASALFNSSKVTIDYIFNNRVPPKYSKLMEALTDHAQLEHTLAREVLEGRREKTSDFTGLKARVMDGLSIPFSKTELLNRGATAIAAYDLARASGKSEADAIRYAIDTTKQLNTSGLGVTAPKYMQHPAGRVFFTFKTFIWNSAFVVGRAFHQAFKGESKEIQREARRQLLGIYGMTMAFAGIKGLPFMGAASTLSEIIAALFGDEDEPFDFDLEMRQFFGDLLYKGGVNYATNLEVSNRVGVANDLLFRDDPRSVAEHGYVLTAMQQAFGPLGSYAVSAGRGAELVARGEVWRGIEAMMPTFVKNGFKGFRYMQEGVLNLKGEPVIEDISAYNTLMQIVGFSPANLSNVYEETALKKGYERDVLRRRSQILNKYDMARRAGDYDLMMEVQEDIDSFNERRIDPKARITPDTLRRSVRAREAAEKNTINGVRFNKSLMPEIERLIEEE
jgi:hypothetical protein